MEHVNILAVLVAAVIGFVYAGAWFQPPVMGNRWQALLLTSKEDRQKGTIKALVLTLVIYAFIAFVMAKYLKALHVQSAGAGALQGLYFGIGFAASNGLVTNLFRAEPLSLFLIENGQIVSTMVIMGSILSVWS